MIVRCLTCQHLIVGEARRTVGCLCDSDAPTWVAVDADRRVIGGSLSHHQIVADV